MVSLSSPPRETLGTSICLSDDFLEIHPTILPQNFRTIICLWLNFQTNWNENLQDRFWYIFKKVKISNFLPSAATEKWKLITQREKLKVTFIYTRHKDSLQQSANVELMSNPFHNFPPFFVSFQSSLVWYFSTINVIYSFFLPQWALKEKKKRCQYRTIPWGGVLYSTNICRPDKICEWTTSTLSFT